VEAELFRAEMTKLINTFRNFVNAPIDYRAIFFSFLLVLFLSVANESEPDKYGSMYTLFNKNQAA